MKLIAVAALGLLCLAQGRETIRRQKRRRASEHPEVREDVYVTFDDSDFFFENEPASNKPTGCSGGSCKKQPRTQEFTFVDEDEWEEEVEYREVEEVPIIKVPVKKIPEKKVPPKKHKRPTPQPKVKKIKRPTPKPAPKKIRKPKPSCGPSCEQVYESDCGPSCDSCIAPCGPTCDSTPVPPRPTPRRRHRPRPRPVREEDDYDRQGDSDRDYWTSYELEDDAYLTAGRYKSNNMASTADPRR